LERVGKILFALALGFFVAEMGGRLFWRLKTKSWFDSGVAWAGNNSFAAQIGGTLAGYTATLAAHPYLAHVHKAGPGINRQGLFGRDFPQHRDPKTFSILVTGGSVACQLVGLQPENGALTQHLEQNYLSADGRPVRVYNGADGGWKLPQQTILIMLYAKLFDLVISLDGFNEVYRLKGNVHLEFPSPNYRTVAPLDFTSKTALMAYWLAAKLNFILGHNEFTRCLWTGYALAHAAMNFARFIDRETAPPTTPLRAFQYQDGEKTPEEKNLRRNEVLGAIKYYLQVNAVLCKKNGSLYISFLQPVPALGKRLSEKEKIQAGPLDYKSDYLNLAAQYHLSSREARYPYYSLLEVFANNSGEIYIDHIHCAPADSGPGYSILAAEVGRCLTKEKILIQVKHSPPSP